MSCDFLLAVYPSLVNEAEVVPEVGGVARGGRRKGEEKDDDLWTPHGERGSQIVDINRLNIVPVRCL